jgi:ABC-2 type transport system permease protein
MKAPVFTPLYTIINKEMIRIFRIWTQTLLPSVITTSLYFLIFGSFVGSQIRDIDGISYMQFIVPGLVMMAIITNSFVNVVGSFFGAKLSKGIEDILVSPTPNWVIVWGYVVGGMVRGLGVGILVIVVALAFTKLDVLNIWAVLMFSILTAMVFSLGGLLNAIFAKKFDHTAIIPTFVLTPLTYLGGVFYSVNALPEFWQNISKFNPILYMVNGFRFGFFGVTDVSITISVVILVILVLILSITDVILLRKGIGLRS